MIYLYVFIFNLPTGESEMRYRHKFDNANACHSALAAMKRPEKNVLAYCATDSERYYSATWWQDKSKDSSK